MRLLFLLFILSSCSSFTGKMAREMTISSYPTEAEVSYFSPTSKQFKTLGKTPFTIAESQIKEWLNNKEDFVILRVSHSGYVIESLFVDLRNRYKLEYTADLKPIDLWNDKEMEVSSTAANKLTVKVQHINQLVFSKNFENALKDAEKLIDQFPKAHVFYDIKGSILVLMGKKGEAMASYQKSIALNPDNSEARKMLERIQGEVR